MAERHDREPPYFRRREEKRREKRAAAAVQGSEPVPSPDQTDFVQSEEPAPPDREDDQDWLFGQAKDRLAAANEAIRSTRTYFFALLSIAAYIGVVVWGTTDEQLLRISPVKLPIINVEVPLTGFYTAVPVLFVLLHFNLLIHLSFTSKKLKVFLDQLKPLDRALADGLRNDVANFPLAQWMAGKHDAVLHVILMTLIWILLVLIPPFLLLWMQFRFLPFGDETFTRIQAEAVVVDALLIVGFRAWFVKQIQPETRWVAGAKELWKQRGLSLVLWLRLLLTQPLFRYLIPLIPLTLAVVFYSIGPPVPVRLDLEEKLLTRNTTTAEVVNALRSDDERVRKQALDQVLGLDLRNRNLRHAYFHLAVLPKADLRHARLQDADLSAVQLQSANLDGAHLSGAFLVNAQLQGASLHQAQLRGANLLNAQLQGAILDEADLQRATLALANLRGASLRAAWLTDADLASANLAEANLTAPTIQRMAISSQTGHLINYEEVGHTDLKGADLSHANLAWTDLTDADLSFADLTGAKNLETAELGGADFTGADLTGTFLDINQPPPDVLPAP